MNKFVAAATAALPLLAVSATAAPRAGVQLGVLECAIGAGTGYIIGSTKDLSCTFKPSGSKFVLRAISAWCARSASTSALPARR